MDAEAERVLGFWLDEVGPDGWYRQDEALDARCRDAFLTLWEQGRDGRCGAWSAAPRSALALVILLDQFPRNMFRADGRAFATDCRALAAAKAAIARGFDLRIEIPARQFLYLPLTHSEILDDQERGVRLFKLRFETGDQLKHAQAHRAVIRRFGRFPHRNAALDRRTTPAEAAWMAAGGYAAEVSDLD